MYVDFLSKITEAAAWTAADIAGGKCGPRDRFNVRQLFNLVRGFLEPDNKASEANDVKEGETENVNAVELLQNKNEETVDDTATKSGLGIKQASFSSITNALEMLHFLGVVPSVQKLTNEEPTNESENFTIRTVK